MVQTLRSPPLVAIGTLCYYSKEQEGAFKMCGGDVLPAWMLGGMAAVACCLRGCLAGMAAAAWLLGGEGGGGVAAWRERRWEWSRGSVAAGRGAGGDVLPA